MAVDVPRVILLIFLLLFLFFSPDARTPSLSQQQELTDQVLLEKYRLDVLNTSTFGDFDTARGSWLNLTGLRKYDNYAWDWLPKVQERARAVSEVVFDTAITPAQSPSDSLGSTSKFSNSIKNIDQDDSKVGSDPLKISDQPFQLYQNTSGIIRGQWSRSKIGQASVAGPLNLTTLAPGHTYTSQDFKRNITGFDGDLRIQLEEYSIDELASEPGLVRGIKAEMLIKDESSSGDGWQIVMFGVHSPQEGGMVFTTTSEKFAGIFALPHFALSERGFSRAQTLLSKTLKTVIDKQEDDLDPNPWTFTPNSPSDALFPTARCEYIVYLQQHLLGDTNASLDDIERELRFPTGLPFQSAPWMKFSALIFSPDCGFVLESKGPPDYPPQEGAHLVGPRLELSINVASRIILCFAVIVSAQIFLIKRQMQDTYTPSTRSRVSLYTIVIMAIGDGFAFMGCLVAGMFIDSLFLPLIATAFVSFLCVSFFGMKFIMDIWTVQAPERQEREREQQRRRDEGNTEAAARNPDTSAPTQSDSLPLPATAHRNSNSTATPVILPPDQDIDAAAAEDANITNGATAVSTTLTTARREIGALYIKFYFLLLGILFLSLHATSWPLPLRSAYCNTLAFTYLSFWTPQVYRNIMRNCRKALRWEFVVGQSIFRFLPFTYFYLNENNVLFVNTDPHALYALAAWVWVQVWILVSQEILGPRFFVKEGWAPPAYDYHPILREDSGGETGSLLPVGFSESLRTTDLSPISPTTSTFAGPSSPALTRQNTGGSTRAAANLSSRRSKNKKDSSSNRRVFDCAICTEDLEVPVMTSSAVGGGGSGGTSASENVGEAATMIFERRKYMVTPCRHIFHSACLEGWMRYRLQCPICRDNLPPL